MKGNLRSIIIEEDTARRGAKGSGAMASKKKSKKEKKEKKEKSKSKKKRSRREPSSSSSSSSDSESENSEEVRAHRAAKMAKKLAARLKQGEIAGYTDNVNPFGDANLTERFVWHKKIEKSLVAGVDPKELGLKAEKRRHEERLKEIEKVKMQREQRDRERMEKEEEREIMQREEALIEAVELEKKEEEFHLQQAKVRSEIRVREGRARAIDLVSRNLHSEDGDDFDESVHPLAIFDGLTLSEMDELRNDVKTYLDLDHKDERHKAFWANMLVVANAEIDEARRRDDYERARSRGEDAFLLNQGVHESVEGDVREMLEGKTHAELEELEGDVENQLATGEESEYWVAVLQRVRVHKARTWVGDVDAGLRSKRAALAPRDVPPPPPMGKTREGEGEGQEDDSDDEDLLGADFGKAAADAGNASDYENEDGGFSPRAMSPAPMSPRGGTPEGDRSFSPEAIRAREDEPDYLDVVDEDEDRRELTRLRAAQKSKKLGRFKEAAGPGATAGATERATFDAFKEGAREAAASHGAVIQNLTADAGEAVEHRRAQEERSRAMAERMMGDGSGEVAFAGEAPLESQVYWWHDKYRPRKPKYFNRVHTGIRVEQVQPDALRPRQPTAEDGARVQVQHLLPRPHRQVQGSHVHHHAGREQARGDVHPSHPRGAPVRRHRVQGCEQGVGVRVEERVQVLVRAGYLPPLHQLQARQVQALGGSSLGLQHHNMIAGRNAHSSSSRNLRCG